MKPFGVDISSYQGRNINYDLMKRKTKFVAVRAGISWGFEDPVFAQSWQALKGHNRIAYHVLYPSQDVTRQVNWLFDILSRAGFDPKTDRLAIDIELWQGMTPQQVATTTERMYDQITERTGRKPIVYSGAWFTNSRMVITEKLKQADWWLATYPPKGNAPGTEHPGPPILPRGVTKWLIHQTSETGIGQNVGLPSGAIDTNRWNGTDAEMQAYFGFAEYEIGFPIIVQPEPEPTEPLYKAKVTAGLGLNVRTCPDMNCKRLRTNPLGTVVDVFETAGEWSRIGAGEWSMSTWLKRIDDAPPPVTVGAYYGANFGQRDPRWANRALGTKSTIGANGCLMTVASMIACAGGYQSNPVVLNDWLTKNGGYHNGNLFVWQKLTECYPKLKWGGMVYSPSDAQMVSAIGRGELLAILVDFDERTPVEDMHWVFGFAVWAGKIMVIDPWTGEVVGLRDKYKKPISRYGFYKL